MKVEAQQLRAFMLDAGLIKERQFDKALKNAKKQGKKIEEVLTAENLISQEDLIRLEAYILGIPFVNLEDEIVEPEVLRFIPEPIARNHNIVAFRRKGKNLEVAMLDPDDLKTIEFIKKKANLKILPRLTTSRSIRNILSQYQESLQTEFGEIIGEEAKEIEKVSQEKKIKEEVEADLEREAQETPIIRIVETLLKHAVLQRATDIHIEPSEKEILVRYRIDGVLRDAMTLPLNTKSGIVARIKVLSNLKLNEHRLPQDGQFKIENKDYKYSCRVSVLPVFDGEKIVLRLLSESAKGYSLEKLGLIGQDLERVERILKKPAGMILVSGSRGCGKTTTLYSILEVLNTPEKNISTIEDPIEYRIPRINQTQLDSKVGLSFASGLRSLLAQDPDIIMVGEINDKETADLAINAVLTGHLILSTLSVDSAAEAIAHLIKMGIEPFSLSSTLNLVIGQRLIRRFSPRREKYSLKAEEWKNLAEHCDLKLMENILKKEKILDKKQTIKDIEFFLPQPSEDSLDGYKGKVAVFETLEISGAIKQLIQKKATSQEIQQRARKEGMRLMVEDAFIKAARGITSIEEVFRLIKEKID